MYKSVATGEPAKFILLTGGNSGIGLEACKILCAEGHEVVATVRSDEKGEHMLREVRAVVPNAELHYMLCEMDDPRIVREFAEEFKSKWLTLGRKLDVLVNNAGCTYNYPKRVTSKINPDWEQTMVVNAMAPILLTDLLMDNLKETAEKKGESRVVFVNSAITASMQWMTSLQTDLDDLMIATPGRYKGGMQTYKNSKTALMMATQALVDEVKDMNVWINSMCPGPVPHTNIAFANTHKSEMRTMKMVKCCLQCCGGQSNRTGGQHIVDMVDGENGRTQGLFYVKGKLTTQGRQVQIKDNQTRMLQMLRDLADSVSTK